MIVVTVIATAGSKAATEATSRSGPIGGVLLYVDSILCCELWTTLGAEAIRSKCGCYAGNAR